MPASFVDQQVQFVATASALEEDFAGVGSSDGRPGAVLRRATGPIRHRLLRRGRVHQPGRQRTAAAADVAFGTPFSQVAARPTQSGRAQGVRRPRHADRGPPSANLENLAVGTASSDRRSTSNGSGLLRDRARPSGRPRPSRRPRRGVARRSQQAGSKAADGASPPPSGTPRSSVDPRYGIWVPASASVFAPFTPSAV